MAARSAWKGCGEAREASEVTCLLPNPDTPLGKQAWQRIRVGIGFLACLVGMLALLSIHMGWDESREKNNHMVEPRLPVAKREGGKVKPPPEIISPLRLYETRFNKTEELDVESHYFTYVVHPLKPKNMKLRKDKKHMALPTNIWWQNLVLDGGAPIVPLPYSIVPDVNSLSIGYSERLTAVTPQSVVGAFVADFTISFGKEKDKMFAPVITDYDDLSVTLQYGNRATLPLVRGSPLISMEINEGRVQLSTKVPIKSLEIPESPPLPGDYSTYQILLTNGQNWIVYTRPAIRLEWSNTSHLQQFPPSSKFTGVFRIGMVTCQAPPAPWNGRVIPCQNDAIKDIIPNLARYPVGGSVDLIPSSDDSSQLVYTWKTKGPKSATSVLTSVLPHHILMIDPAQAALARQAVTNMSNWQSHLNHYCVKGPMTPLLVAAGKKGNAQIQFNLKLPRLGFYEEAKIPPNLTQDIEKSLREDLQRSSRIPGDTYHFGKILAKYARLALIANAVGLVDEKQKALAFIETQLNNYINSDSPNSIVYDTTWGGLIVQHGLDEPVWDFGNAYYNDHHFHYGYFIYAVAIWVHLNRAARETAPQSPLVHFAAGLVKDIASEKITSKFPRARHKDFFHGHSWASGLFKMLDGREQESCSEAVNGYYAVSLLGKALRDTKMERFGRELAAMEILSARTYYQIPSMAVETNPRLFPQGLYPPAFSTNAMVGVVGSLMASHSTWFGSNVEYVHGIQMIPFTPATYHLLPQWFMKREFGQLAKALVREDPALEESWAGYVHMAQAIIDPKGAWGGLQTLNASKFDDGNSLANAMFWVATRPQSANVLSH